MSEKEQVEKIRAVLKILVDQCNSYTDCLHCPFEKQLDGGYGACKFRRATGSPAWPIVDMYTGDVEED